MDFGLDLGADQGLADRPLCYRRARLDPKVSRKKKELGQTGSHSFDPISPSDSSNNPDFGQYDEDSQDES